MGKAKRMQGDLNFNDTSININITRKNTRGKKGAKKKKKVEIVPYYDYVSLDMSNYKGR